MRHAHKFLMLKRLILSAAINFSLITSATAADDKLIFALDIVRHGDRTPVVAIPNAPHNWQEGLGELTALGMQQEYALGQKLHQQYIVNLHLLPEHYSAASMYVRSTDLNRTLMSAQSLLLALYPLGTGQPLPLSINSSANCTATNFQPIPIHTRARESDALYISFNQNYYNPKILPPTGAVYQRLAQLTHDYRPQLARWSKLSGLKLDNIMQLDDLADNLEIRHLKGVAFPPGFNQQDYQQIQSLVDQVQQLIFSDRNVGINLTPSLRALIAQNLTAATVESAPRYVLYLAHDTTQLALMSALGKPLAQPPHYASDLQILLVQNPQSKQYRVKLNFNDQPVFFQEQESALSLDQFIKILTPQPVKS